MRPTRDVEVAAHTEVRKELQDKMRDFAAMSCYCPQTSSISTGMSQGILRYYQCGRCGRCWGYYWPPGSRHSDFSSNIKSNLPGTRQSFTCTQPITYQNSQQLESASPTRDCCPCPPSVRQVVRQILQKLSYSKHISYTRPPFQATKLHQAFKMSQI